MKKVLDKLKDANLEAYKSIPFWSWNAKLEPQELIKQIHWMKERLDHSQSEERIGYFQQAWMVPNQAQWHTVLYQLQKQMELTHINI